MTGAGKTRTYNYIYDNANRLTTANDTASGETNWFTVNGMLYDANGNITKLVRGNQMTSSTYGEVDNLTYTYQTNSNRLSQVADSHLSATFTSKGFKERSDIALESILQTINKGVNKISNYVIDFLYGEREEK